MVVGQRQSLVSGSNRNANHPVNAMLKYAYGVLESQVRIATVTSGLDPGIGYLHACRPGRSALVYDLMEPLRPLVDRLLIGFIRSHTFTPADPRFRGGKLSDNVKGYLPASPPLS